MDYNFKTKPFKHQLDALARSAGKRNFAYFMEMGCVDEETEFLTQRGWVKFGDFDLEKWKRPLLVAQAMPVNNYEDIKHWSFEFTEPLAFIKKDSNDWYEFSGQKSEKHIDGVVYRLLCTGDHTFPVEYTWKSKGIMKKGDRVNFNYHREQLWETTAKYINQVFERDPEREPKFAISMALRMALINRCTGGFFGFKSEHFIPSEISELTEWELRFMVAVAADGTYPNKSNNKVDFYFKKERKAKRLKMIAKRAGIPMVSETRVRGGEPVYIFHAIAPLRYKEFTEEWYSLSYQKLQAFVDEIFRWDGSFSKREAMFYSTSKDTIDFVQYALMACGWSSTIIGQRHLWALKAYYHNCHDKCIVPDPGESYDGYMELDNGRTTEGTFKLTSGKKLRKCTKTAYCFRVPSGYLILRRNNKIFISGNSGKTKVMLDNIGVLHNKGQITGALVLAPKGVYRNWSEKEIPTHLPDDINREVLVWDAAASQGRKDKLLKQIRDWDGKTLQFLVFNIESLISEKGRKLIVDFIKRHNGDVFALVDESTCIKNHKAKRTKAAIEIGQKCKARRIATGSPVTNSPLDLYSQCAFLDKSLLGCGSYYAFKNTYAVIERVQNRQGQHYEKILSYKNLDHLSELLDKFSYRVTKKECLDLPDKIYMTRDVELTPEQIKVYKEMDDYQFSLLQQKENQFQEMSAQVILTKLLRLHQVLCGTFTSDDGTIVRLPNNRITALKEVLDETSGKAIIWATYLADIEAIAGMLEKEYGAGSFVTYYGATSSDDRTRAINEFQNPKSPVRFFLGNVQTAGRGITLTEASTVIYYSNNFSLELRQQSEDRAHRLGQKNNVTYIDLVVRGSLDEKIIKSLLEKRNIANEILKDDLEPWISLKLD